MAFQKYLVTFKIYETFKDFSSDVYEAICFEDSYDTSLAKEVIQEMIAGKIKTNSSNMLLIGNHCLNTDKLFSIEVVVEKIED